MSLWERLFRRNRLERDLDDEIAAHLRMATQDRVDRGVSIDEAGHAARREFGNTVMVKEVTRGMWGWAAVETVFADAKFARRMIVKNWAWALAVVLSIALGVGANTAIFSLTYAVLLKSLPVPDPSALVRYTFRNGAQEIGLSGPAYDSLRRHQAAATDLLAWSGADLAVQENGTVLRVPGALLSGNGFRVLGLQPYLGNAFSEADDVHGAGVQALLGYSFWKAHYAGNPQVVGRSLVINGKPVTIAGVLPEGFDGLIAELRADIVLPLAFDEVLQPPKGRRNNAGAMWLTVMGRLKPGESLTSAEANLRSVEAAVRQEADPSHQFLAGFFAPFRFGVASGRSGRSYLKTAYERPLLVLELLVGLLLVLCGANAALLILAQVTGRAREFSMRTALGAGRGRLVRQVLLEILLLAIPGLALAVGMGWALAHWLIAMLAEVGEPPALDVGPNPAVLLFTGLITLMVAVGAGLWPAFRASRTAPALNLKEREQAGSGKQSGAWIIPAQVAVSVTLVAAALLLGNAFLQIYSTQTGFRAGNAVLADVDLRPAKLNDKQATTAARRIVDELSSVGGIQYATAMSLPPLHDFWSAGHFFSVDQRGTVHTDMSAWAELVTPSYFNAIGTRLLAGRGFTRSDEQGQHTCVLSRSAANYFFPSGDALGRFVYNGGEDPASDGRQIDAKNALRVVGIAEDTRFRSLRETPPRMLYTLMGPDDLGSQFTLLVRSDNKSLATEALRSAVHRVVPSAPVPTVFSFGALINAHLSKERMLIGLSGSFASIALILTAIGLFGLLMRSVTQRTREIGIRVALGAERSSVVASVLRGAGWQIAVGLVAGIAIAAASSRAIAALLYGTGGAGWWVYAGSVVCILVVGAVAAWIPARRAAGVDPMVALRYE